MIQGEDLKSPATLSAMYNMLPVFLTHAELLLSSLHPVVLVLY